MADAAPKRRRGRPTVKAGEPSVSVGLQLSVSDYDKACTLARRNRVSVPAVLRAAFRVATKRQDPLDEP